MTKTWARLLKSQLVSHEFLCAFFLFRLLRTNTDSNIAEEDKKLAYIRNNYFPDIILNYLSALYYASLKLDRGLLTRNMEVAIVLAEDNLILDCFRHACRLRELADAMALASVAMVNAPAEAKVRKKTDGPARLDIWNIEVPNADNDARVPSKS